MSWIARAISSLRRGRMERRLDDELAFHLEMRARAATPEEAMRRFGSVTRVKESCRDVDTVGWIGGVRADARYAVRSAFQNPGFTLAAALCLALGIGAETAVFSFVNALLFQPLAVRQPEQMVSIQRQDFPLVSYLESQDWKSLDRVFSGFAVHSSGENLTFGNDSHAPSILGEAVASDYFQTLGIHPRIGRLIEPDDLEAPLAVIGERLWRNQYAADSSIVGRTILINHRPFIVAGIAPESFRGLLSPWVTDVWTTLALHPGWLRDRNAASLLVSARLRPNVTPPQANAAINGLDAQLQKLHPDPQRRLSAKLEVRQAGTLLAGSPMWIILSALWMAVAAIVFLIACVNVSGLLIARGMARRREILIRLSLGASRGRLVRQLLTESCLLALIGGILGVVLAFAAGDGIGSAIPASIGGGYRIAHGIDLRVLGVTLALSVASALIAGLLPALRASDQNLAAAGRTHDASDGRTPRLRQAMIALQVALSTVVLIMAGDLAASVRAGQGAATGFDAPRLTAVYLDLRDSRIPVAARVLFYRQFAARIASLPGIDSVSLSDTFPLGRTERVVRAIATEGSAPISVPTSAVDAAYFQTMGIALLRGRTFAQPDHDAVIVNQAMARRLWPGRDAVGSTIRLRPNGPSQLVIGIARDVKFASLTEPARPMIYTFASAPGEAIQYLAFHTSGAAEDFSGAVEREAERAANNGADVTVRTANILIARWLEPQRAAAALLAVFGLMALGLAITGLYGLVAHVVAQRTSEIAVRMAIGASRNSVVRLVLRQSLIPIGAGLAAGFFLAEAASRGLASIARDVVPAGAGAFFAAAAILLAAGIAAAAIPAWRALRIDPAAALRIE